MESDERLELIQELQGTLWIQRLNACCMNDTLCTWVSTLHTNKLSCQIADRQLRCGSYNCGPKVLFEDGSTWLVRFPRNGSVHPRYADEKVAMEVAIMTRVLQDTTVPVPDIKAWGIAADNPLDMGPFIMMDFLEDAVNLGTLLRSSVDSRLLREDVTDAEIRRVYEQFVDILVQLYQLTFDHIGNVASVPGSNATRPLTWKSHDILQTGGVNTCAGDRSRRSTSTAEYFEDVIKQDSEQLTKQANSVFGPATAGARYRAVKALSTLTRSFVHEKCDRTGFKLICDDLGLANLMVRSREDLTVVGVVDWEWSYAGPAQLAASAPWWLLMDRSTNVGWDFEDGIPPPMADRFARYLEIYKSVLADIDKSAYGNAGEEFTDLVHWSESSGAMWFHMLIQSGFNESRTFPWSKLIQQIGTDEWEKLKASVEDDGGEAEVEAFSWKKAEQLEGYESELQVMKEDHERVKQGKITKETFVDLRLGILPE